MRDLELHLRCHDKPPRHGSDDVHQPELPRRAPWWPRHPHDVAHALADRAPRSPPSSVLIPPRRAGAQPRSAASSLAQTTSTTSRSFASSPRSPGAGDSTPSPPRHGSHTELHAASTAPTLPSSRARHRAPTRPRPRHVRARPRPGTPCRAATLPSRRQADHDVETQPRCRPRPLPTPTQSFDRGDAEAATSIFNGTLSTPTTPQSSATPPSRRP